MYTLGEVESITKTTVKEFYSLNECQREFITKLVDNDEVKFSRIDLMKMLMIHSKSKEIGCDMDSNELSQYSKFIDDNSTIINNYLNLFDKEFRESCGVVA